MHLTGLTVCVDYSDFFEEVLKINKTCFDRYVIITSLKDKKTQELCRQNNLECFITDSFYENTCLFNKGLALSLALEQLNFSGWIVIHDADTAMSFDFRDKISSDMDINKIYGGSRKFIPTYKEWIECLKNHDNFNKYESIPGVACGFLQIFSMESEVIKNCLGKEYIYPPFPTAEQTDILFLYRFCPPPDPKPEKLDITCFHLGIHGMAHEGRGNSKNPAFRTNFKDMKDLTYE